MAAEEIGIVSPDYEVLVRDQHGREVFVAGLFTNNGDTVDVGLGIEEPANADAMAAILTYAVVALDRCKTWHAVTLPADDTVKTRFHSESANDI